MKLRGIALMILSIAVGAELMLLGACDDGYKPNPNRTGTTMHPHLKPTTTRPTVRHKPAPAHTTKHQAVAGSGFTCNDGTYSNAVHRQGACSHHGGVRG